MNKLLCECLDECDCDQNKEIVDQAVQYEMKNSENPDQDEIVTTVMANLEKNPEHYSDISNKSAQNEISAGGGGAVAGGPGVFGKEEQIKDLQEEIKLRIAVRKILKEKHNLEIKTLKKQMADERKFRAFAREMIKEERLERKIMVMEAKATPMLKNTGLNALQTVINKVIPIVKDDYKSLTTSASQRKSFRAHIVNALKNSLAPIRAVEKGIAKPEDVNLPSDMGMGDSDTPMLDVPAGEVAGMQQEADLNVNTDDADEETAQDKFIDIDADPEDEPIPDEELSPGERAEKNFDIEGEDNTGRNFALDTFKRIEKIIIDEYMKLDNQEDKDIFYEFAITNFKLYFDRWEDEIQSNIQES